MNTADDRQRGGGTSDAAPGVDPDAQADRATRRRAALGRGQGAVVVAALLSVLLCVPAGLRVQTAATEGFYGPSSPGDDARILFLGARAVAAGRDPTDPETIAEFLPGSGILSPEQEAAVGSRDAGGGRNSRWASKYPAALHVLLVPLAREDWAGFLLRWRWLSYVGVLVGAVAAGLSGARGRLAPLGAAIGLWLLASPTTGLERNLALGQANVLLVGLTGLGMFLASRGRLATAGAVAALGATVKVVPIVLFAPMGSSRAWRGLVVGLLALALVLLLSGVVLGFEPVLADLSALTTHRPVGGGSPALPEWMRELLDLRGGVMAWCTVGVPLLAGLLAARAPAARREILAGTLALACVWLGSTGRLHLPIYDLLGLPAAAWLLAGALPARGGTGPGLRWLWAPAGLALLVLDDPGSSPEPTTEPTFGLMILWLGTAMRVASAGLWAGISRRRAMHRAGRCPR